MLTHQKRKLFHCAELGCQRSYCDAHSLKRHCLSQHGIHPKPTTSESTSTHSTLHPTAHWEPAEDTLSVQGSSDQSGYPTIFIPAPKTVTDTQSVSANYHSYVDYNNYTGFSTVVRGLGVSQFTVEGGAQEKPLVGQDQWIPGPTKGMYAMSRGEAVPSEDMQGSTQWPVGLEPESSVISADSAAAQSFGADGLSAPCWENTLDFPMSDLQALDNMLSFQSSRETANCHDELVDRPASSENSNHTRLETQPSQHSHINESLTQVKKIKSETLSPWPISSHEFTTAADLPPIAPQSQLSVLAGMHAIPKKVDKAKKRARKRKITVDDVLPLQVYYEDSVPLHPRSRPGFLVSPSQVAMASFSADNAPYPSFKVCVCECVMLSFSVLSVRNKFSVFAIRVYQHAGEARINVLFLLD